MIMFNFKLFLLSLVISTQLVMGQSFFDVDTDILEGKPGHRSLLQVDEEIEEKEKEKEKEREEPPKEEIKLTNEAGPEKFFLGENSRLPKLLMEVKEGIHLTINEVW